MISVRFLRHELELTANIGNHFEYFSTAHNE